MLTQILFLKLLRNLQDIGFVFVESFDAPGNVRRGFSLVLDPSADLSAAGSCPTEEINWFREIYLTQAEGEGREGNKLGSGNADHVPFILLADIDKFDIFSLVDEGFKIFGSDFWIHVIWR